MLPPSLISGAFLTLAIVMGEYTIASFLARPAFGPYLSLLGRNRAYEPAAVALISFAITWIARAFPQGVTANTLTRALSEEEINTVDYDHGFHLSRAYDGFLEKMGDRFACGLCPEEKRANWKNKKDSIRHLQKFHFGIGETCGTW